MSADKMTVFARETAGSPRDLWSGGRCPSGIPVRLPFRKRWCRKVDGFDFGTLWHPLMPGSGHRFLEDDNVRLLRPDSGATSGTVFRCCLARPAPAPARPSAATTTHVRRLLDFPKKHQKTRDLSPFDTGKTGQKMSFICSGYRGKRFWRRLRINFSRVAEPVEEINLFPLVFDIHFGAHTRCGRASSRCASSRQTWEGATSHDGRRARPVTRLARAVFRV